MRKFFSARLLIASFAMVGLGMHGVFAQDATPISDATPAESPATP